jgi:hypothetical protein
LLGGLGIPVIETRKILVVTEQDDAARVVAVESDRGAQPAKQLRLQRAVRGKNALENGPAGRIVAGVDRDDPPMLVLEAKEARALALRFFRSR